MSYTLRKSSQGIWIQGAPRAGRLAKSQGLLVVLGGTKTGTLRKSQEQTVNTLDKVAIRVLNMSQRLWPNGHLADVSGKLFGTGIYDPVNVSFVSIEKEVDGIGWTLVTARPSDPAQVFPSQADGDGADFNLVVEVDEWSPPPTKLVRFRVTTAFTGPGSQIGTGGPWTWISNILPGFPAWILVPASSASGNFTVSWADLDGASGYELAEGVEQPDTSIVWGSYFDVGDVNTYGISGKTEGKYWYRVRAYNPVPNYGGARTSTNSCSVERPGFKVTPDLGWADVDSMFEPLLNGRLTQFPLDELATTLLTPSAVMGRYNMVFDHSGTNYLIPGNQIGKFGASGRHLWRYMADPVNVFTVAKEALNVGGVPSLPRSVQPRILR